MGKTTSKSLGIFGKEDSPKGTCLSCGKCCRTHIHLVRRPNPEMKMLMEWRDIEVKDLKPEELPKHLRPDIAWSLLFIPTNPCKHLDLKTNKCKIYEDRPQTCKDYPKQEFMLLPECGYTRK